MTNIEKILDKFARSYNAETISLMGDKAIITLNGKTMTVSMNIYGDIINTTTGKIIAESNLSHDVVTIGYAYPTAWKIIN